MINSIAEKAKGFLLNPIETFRQSVNDDPGTVFTYFGVLLLINAIISSLVAAAGIGSMETISGQVFGPAFPVMVFFLVLVGGFIVTVLFSVWLHLWVYLLGGRRGIMQTMGAILYGSTPHNLLGWIPVAGFIFTLWSIVLGIFGICKFQEMSSGKAILAVLVAIVIPLIVIILIAAYFFISYVTTTVSPVSAFSVTAD
jgi:hypothetical protein